MSSAASSVSAPAPATESLNPIAIDGPLLVSTADAWRSRLLLELAAAPCLALDLARCEAFDAFGLQLLWSARRAAELQGRGFRLLHLPPAFAPACERAGFNPASFADLSAQLP